MSPLRAQAGVCIYGLGGIGAATARKLLGMEDVRIVAAIDTDRAKTGRDLRSILRLRGASGVKVSADAATTLRRAAPDVVIHCTGSRLADIAPQLEQIIDAGIPCVTSSEEMALPDDIDPDLAGRLDRAARARGVALLGAGVNPGFAMDALVLALSGATCNVTRIAVERVLDPLSRRRAFRSKVGLGLTFAQASRLVEQGRMGHVGLRQSALLVARGMGWSPDRVDEEVEVLCETAAPAKRSRRRMRPDAPVVGLHQTLWARQGRRELIRMEMLMAAGVEAPHDAVIINGDPDLNLWVQGGIPGDQSTVACLVNGMWKVLDPPRPGLLTLLDVPLRASRSVAPTALPHP